MCIYTILEHYTRVVDVNVCLLSPDPEDRPLESFRLFARDSIVPVDNGFWLNAMISSFIILSCSDALLLPICYSAHTHTLLTTSQALVVLLSMAKM